MKCVPKGSNQKFKLYRLAQIMQEQTDDEHYITMPEIMDELAKYNITGFPTKILISPDGIILYRAMNETDEFYENVTKFIK